MPESIDQDVDRSAGDDRNHDLVRRESARKLTHHRLKHLRLDGEQHEIGAVRGLTVAFRGQYAEALLEPQAPIFTWVTGDYVLRRDESVLEQPRNHRLGHDARPNERNTGVVKWTRCSERGVVRRLG
jgi:hypothetical protein